jgi:hypothetical protein
MIKANPETHDTLKRSKKTPQRPSHTVNQPEKANRRVTAAEGQSTRRPRRMAEKRKARGERLTTETVESA